MLDITCLPGPTQQHVTRLLPSPLSPPASHGPTGPSAQILSSPNSSPS